MTTTRMLLMQNYSLPLTVTVLQPTAPINPRFFDHLEQKTHTCLILPDVRINVVIRSVQVSLKTDFQCVCMYSFK